MSNNNPRDYGLGNPTVDGSPRLGPYMDDAEALCPYCKGHTLFELSIDVIDKRLRGGKGIGKYLGCAACPYASPMVMVANAEAK